MDTFIKEFHSLKSIEMQQFKRLGNQLIVKQLNNTYLTIFKILTKARSENYLHYSNFYHFFLRKSINTMIDCHSQSISYSLKIIELTTPEDKPLSFLHS